MGKYNPEQILDQISSLTKKIMELFGVDNYTALVTAINLIEKSLGADLSDFRGLLPAVNNTARYQNKFVGKDDNAEDVTGTAYFKSRLDG